MQRNDDLSLAQKGDIQAFHRLFSEFQEQLKSFLLRISGDRNLVEDVFHDSFIKAFDKLSSFKQNSSLKTWVFSIATNHLKNLLKKQNRWSVSTQEDVRRLAHSDESSMALLDETHHYSQYGQYLITEHIDYCLTCIGNTLPLQQQLSIFLKDIYGFQNNEVAEILNLTIAKVKHHLHQARQMMDDIFDQQCALVNKTGACFQCSGLNKKYNPKADTQRELMKIQFFRDNDVVDKKRLLKLRFDLIRGINPLAAKGYDLHQAFFKLARDVNKSI